MKGQKEKRKQNGDIGSALNLNQTQEQLIEELRRVIADKDVVIAENAQVPYAHHGKPHSSYNLSRLITAEFDPLKINLIAITALE